MLLVRAITEEVSQTDASALEYASGFVIVAAIVGILVPGYALGILRNGGIESLRRVTTTLARGFSALRA